MSIFRKLARRDVQAAIASIDNEPAAWEPNYHSGKLFSIIHSRSGLSVWCANSVYGMEIKERRFGTVLWGGVGFLSSFGLNLNHWILWAAVNRWRRAYLHIARRGVAEILRESAQ